MRFEETGLPDKGKLREAFTLAAANYTAYTAPQYVFESRLKTVQHIAAIFPQTSPDVLVGAMLSALIVEKEDPPSPENPRWEDVLETYGVDAAENLVTMNRAWLKDEETCPPRLKEKEDFRSVGPEVKKFLLANAIADLELVAEGKFFSMHNVKNHIRRYAEAYSVMKGEYPQLDTAFDRAFDAVRGVLSGKAPAAIMKKSFDEVLKLFRGEQKKNDPDIFVLAFIANEAFVRRDSAGRRLTVQDRQDIHAGVAEIRAWLKENAAELDIAGLKFHAKPVVDKDGEKTYKTFERRPAPGHA